jgi:hypothetical protein
LIQDGGELYDNSDEKLISDELVNNKDSDDMIDTSYSESSVVKNNEDDIIPFYSSESRSSSDFAFQHPYVRNRFN